MTKESKEIETSHREVKVLGRPFCSGANYDMTLEEVGIKYGVSIERIHQIEAKALKRMRSELKNRSSSNKAGFLDTSKR